MNKPSIQRLTDASRRMGRAGALRDALIYATVGAACIGMTKMESSTWPENVIRFVIGLILFTGAVIWDHALRRAASDYRAALDEYTLWRMKEDR